MWCEITYENHKGAFRFEILDTSLYFYIEAPQSQNEAKFWTNCRPRCKNWKMNGWSIWVWMKELDHRRSRWKYQVCDKLLRFEATTCQRRLMSNIYRPNFKRFDPRKTYRRGGLFNVIFLNADCRLLMPWRQRRESVTSVMWLCLFVIVRCLCDVSFKVYYSIIHHYHHLIDTKIQIATDNIQWKTEGMRIKGKRQGFTVP